MVLTETRTRVVEVLSGSMFGPGDAAPTASGQLVCDFPAGKSRASPRAARTWDARRTQRRYNAWAMTHVKICGVTSVHDAAMCVEAGADAIGLNFAPRSPRCLDLATAATIMRVIPQHVISVGVFVDADRETLLRYRDTLGLRCLQLHGDEPPELLAELLPHAYKALRVRGPGVKQEAERYPGAFLLLDAYVPGVHGGSGARFDWGLALELASSRKLTLAGGLTPQNVAEAIAAVQPFCVDVASGVESAPGKKDEALVRAFISNTRAAG